MINGSGHAKSIPGANRPVNPRLVGSAARSVALLLSISLPMFAACIDNYRQITPVSDKFAWPGAIVADPAGDFVYVVSTNFDSRYTGGTLIPVQVRPADGGAPVPVSKAAVEIGPFGGDAAVSLLGDGTTRIWVPIRDGDQLDLVDSVRDSSNLPELECIAEESRNGAKAGVDGDAFAFHRCSGDHVIDLRDFDFVDEEGTTFWANDAYGVSVGSHLRTMNGPGVNPVYVSGIVGSAVSIFTAAQDGTLQWRATLPITEGAHSIMEYVVDEFTRVLWITNRSVNLIDIIKLRFDRFGNVHEIPVPSVSADLLGSSGDYFREMVRSNDGRLLYAAFRSPSSLTIFEILDGGGLRYRGLIPLDGNPSGVAIYDDHGKEVVYVTESSLDFVYVIDPAAMAVVSKVFVGAAPSGIAIADGRAFVANFEDSTVSWFGVDSLQPDYHQVGIVEPRD